MACAAGLVVAGTAKPRAGVLPGRRTGSEGTSRVAGTSRATCFAFGWRLALKSGVAIVAVCGSGRARFGSVLVSGTFFAGSGSGDLRSAADWAVLDASGLSADISAQ